MEKTIGEIVTEDYRTALVFNRYGIDFCCGGKKNIEDVCRNNNLDLSELITELEKAVLNRNAEGMDPATWPLKLLADYIESVHHSYVVENVPFLLQLSEKVERAHGEKYPYLSPIRKAFHELVLELDSHMRKEEQILFPYIRDLEKTGSKPYAPFGSVLNPINMMEHEHESAGKLIHEIRELSNHYTLPDGACRSFTVLYNKLEEFQNDLFRHIHLENNILFPGAITLERKLLNKVPPEMEIPE